MSPNTLQPSKRDEIAIQTPVYDTIDEEKESHEVFKKTQNGGVDFRTVSWQRAAIIFLKIQFAMSILSVPSACAALGAVGGALSIVGWDALNTCTITQTLQPRRTAND